MLLVSRGDAITTKHQERRRGSEENQGPKGDDHKVTNRSGMRMIFEPPEEMHSGASNEPPAAVINHRSNVINHRSKRNVETKLAPSDIGSPSVS